MRISFEWDGSKSDTCYQQRGFDFAYASRVFDDLGKIIVEDRRWGYRERRYQVLGRIEGRLFIIVYTIRPGRIRIISARKANYREVKAYETGLYEPPEGPHRCGAGRRYFGR
ncbi:BrnT family toxin [Pollutimonas thiosulfatoxidans]|uniref:BrnT family toxin n=1 Tax=Pollutimonas thiosulfatoxidans TaxID=2028345 RepID=UPI001D17F8E2|nr:BrnT family toxin [Pollutimonas thiosulfatoxidans]